MDNAAYREPVPVRFHNGRVAVVDCRPFHGTVYARDDMFGSRVALDDLDQGSRDRLLDGGLRGGGTPRGRQHP